MLLRLISKLKISRKAVVRAALFAAFAATVWGANWALAKYGVVSIGFGLVAPAGVFFAGLAFTFRDLLHESSGRLLGAGRHRNRIRGPAVGAGPGGRSDVRRGERYGVPGQRAGGLRRVRTTPLRERGWLRAVFASNVVGFTVDSLLFLWLAFGSLDFIAIPGPTRGQGVHDRPRGGRAVRCGGGAPTTSAG